MGITNKTPYTPSKYPENPELSVVVAGLIVIMFI